MNFDRVDRVIKAKELFIEASKNMEALQESSCLIVSDPVSCMQYTIDKGDSLYSNFYLSLESRFKNEMAAAKMAIDMLMKGETDE